MIKRPSRPTTRATRSARFLGAACCIAVAIFYAFPVWLSLGSGWTYPHLGPDRLDGQPWRTMFRQSSVLVDAIAMSAAVAFAVATASTIAGLMTAKRVAVPARGWGRWLALTPFVLSPVIVAICWQDLFIRVGLASSVLGVMLAQSIFAYGFATVFFSELWDRELHRYEALIATLGGGWRARLRHAWWPRMGRLFMIAWFQTGLFSWLDYGLVSVIGGGRVVSVTMVLFASLREANLNQAMQAGLLLMLPAVVISSGMVLLLGRSTAQQRSQR